MDGKGASVDIALLFTTVGREVYKPKVAFDFIIIPKKKQMEILVKR